jgi:adhesin/invasin
VAGAPATLSIVSGNNQTAPAGSQLPLPLVVQVKDQYGNNISGATVSFSDGGAGGILSPPNPVTNNSGQASTNYTLPTSKGTVQVTASINGLSQSFTETSQ